MIGTDATTELYSVFASSIGRGVIVFRWPWNSNVLLRLQRDRLFLKELCCCGRLDLVNASTVPMKPFWNWQELQSMAAAIADKEEFLGHIVYPRRQVSWTGVDGFGLRAERITTIVSRSRSRRRRSICGLWWWLGLVLVLVMAVVARRDGGSGRSEVEVNCLHVQSLTTDRRRWHIIPT